MREILFRGKLTANGKWSEGNLQITKNGVAIITPDETVIGCYGQVIPETIGQYTGLKDSNGTRIFEGDIVENERIIGFVFYKECDASFELKWKNADKHRKDFFKTCYLSNYSGLDSLKVIGNIFDNPELLEVAE